MMGVSERCAGLVRSRDPSSLLHHDPEISDQLARLWRLAAGLSV